MLPRTLLLLVAAACQLPAANPALVQACGNNTATGTSGTVSLGSAPTDGNNLFLIFTTPTIQVVSSVSGGGVTWLHAVINPTNRVADIWYGENVSSGGTTITVNFGGSLPGTLSDLNICEFSGLKTSGSIDQTNTNTNAGSTVASVALTPTSGNNSVIITGESFVSGQSMTGGGFTQITTTNSRNAAAYLIATPTSGSYTPQFTGSSNAWGMAIANFNAPATCTSPAGSIALLGAGCK